MNDLPKENDKTSDKVCDKLYENLRKHIMIWEKENLDNKIPEKIKTVIEKEFPTFISALDNLENEMSGRLEEENEKEKYLKDDTLSVIPDFLQKILELPVLKKIIVAPLTPALLIGFLGRLPYVGIKHFGRFMGVKFMSGAYKKAIGDTEKANVCTQYAEKLFNDFTDRLQLENIIKKDMTILADLLDKQEDKAKRKIEVDRRLLWQLEADSRDAVTATMFYEPLQSKVKRMIYHIVCFRTKHFPTLTTVPPCVTSNTFKGTDTEVCSGVRRDHGCYPEARGSV